MKFRGLVSVLCSATCGIGGVGARQNGGMKEKIAQMKKQSEEKVNKILEKVKIEGLGKLKTKEAEESLKAQGVISLLNGEVSDFGDVLGILENLDKDPEAKKKALEFANVLKGKVPVRRFAGAILRSFSVASGVVGLVAALSVLFSSAVVKKIGLEFFSKSFDAKNDKEACRTVFIGGLVIFVVSLVVSGGFMFGGAVSYSSSFRYSGMEEALRKLVKEAEGIQNQAVASGNKLKEKKSGSSASNGGSQKSGKKGSRKSEGKKGSKVKDKEVDNS